MDLHNIPLFAALQKRMTWLSERETVLASNVANADTPGFLAKDLKQPDFGALVKGASHGELRLATTQPSHIAVDAGGDLVPTPVTDGEAKLTGNTVSLEDQMMKVSETASDYALTTNLYRAHLGLIKTALGHS